MKGIFDVLDEITSRQRITNNPTLSSSICQKFRPHCPKEILLEKGNCDCAPGACLCFNSGRHARVLSAGVINGGGAPRIPISALNPVPAFVKTSTGKRTCPFQTKDRLRRRDRYAENRFCISDGSQFRHGSS